MSSWKTGTLYVPRGLDLWELAAEHNWDLLETYLDSMEFDSLCIVDEASEKHLSLIHSTFERSADNNGNGIVALLSKYKNPHLLRRVLALGLSPDSRNHKLESPSHICCVAFSSQAAKILCDCRVNLMAKNDYGLTAGELSSCFKNGVVHQAGAEMLCVIWAEAKRDGFRPLAQLAAEKKWWAIKNICRRRKFSEEEISTVYHNLTVVQWAEKHGEEAMAKELRYFLGLKEEETVVQEAKLLPLGKECELQNAVNEAKALLRSEFGSCQREKMEELEALRTKIDSLGCGKGPHEAKPKVPADDPIIDMLRVQFDKLISSGLPYQSIRKIADCFVAIMENKE